MDAVTYDRLNAALEGEVIVQIGHVSPLEVKLLDQAVRAGKLTKFRGKWFPITGAKFGIGPNKMCWATPEVAARVQSIA